MRLRTWLILGYSAVLALATLGLGLGLLTVLGLAATSERMVENDFRAIDLASRLRILISAQQMVVVKRLVDGEGDVARRMPPFEREALSLLRQARTLGPTDPVKAALITRVETAVNDLVDAIEETATSMPPSPATAALTTPEAAPVSRITPAVVARFESLRAATLDYYQHHHEAMLGRGTHIMRQSDRLALALGLLAVFTVLIGVLTSLRLADRLSAPMERLAEAAARVAAGDFEVRVGRTGLSEADLVAQRFDDMAAALARFHAMNLDRIVAESQRMDQVVAHIDVGLMIFDEQGEIERINPVASAQLGLTQEHSVGRRIEEVADFPPLALAIQKLIARPDAVLIDTADLKIGSDDAQHVLCWTLRPFSDAARLGLILVLRDVTATRQFERMRTDFVLRASHELRTPITGMRMALGLLEGKLGFAPDSREAELVSTLEEEMRRLINLISALLDLSRLYAHTYALKRTPNDVEELLRRVSKRFSPVVHTAGLTLELELEADLPPRSAGCRCDGSGVRQPARQCDPAYPDRRPPRPGRAACGKPAGAVGRGFWRRHRLCGPCARVRTLRADRTSRRRRRPGSGDVPRDRAAARRQHPAGFGPGARQSLHPQLATTGTGRTGRSARYPSACLADCTS